MEKNLGKKKKNLLPSNEKKVEYPDNRVLPFTPLCTNMPPRDGCFLIF